MFHPSGLSVPKHAFSFRSLRWTLITLSLCSSALSPELNEMPYLLLLRHISPYNWEHIQHRSLRTSWLPENAQSYVVTCAQCYWKSHQPQLAFHKIGSIFARLSLSLVSTVDTVALTKLCDDQLKMTAIHHKIQQIPELSLQLGSSCHAARGSPGVPETTGTLN